MNNTLYVNYMQEKEALRVSSLKKDMAQTDITASRYRVEVMILRLTKAQRTITR